MLKRLVVVLVMLLGLLLGLWVAVDNTQPLTVTLMGFVMPQLPSGLWLTLVLLLGTVLGFVLSWLPVLQSKAQLRRLQKQLLGRDRELEQLRATLHKGQSREG